MNKKTVFSAALILMSVLACAMPGSGTSQPESVATTNPDTISTMMVITAQSMAAQTVAAIISMTPPTPIPTETATLAPTLPPTSTSTPEPTSTPDVASSPMETATFAVNIADQGTVLTKQGDASYHFADQGAGYEMDVPAGWLAVRVDQQELANAATLPEAADPSIQAQLQFIQKQDPKIFRLFGLDTRQGHNLNQFATNFNILWDVQDTGTIADTLAKVRQQYPIILPTANILVAEERTTNSGNQIGFVETEIKSKTAAGQEFILTQKQYVFNLKVGKLVLTVSTTAEMKELITPEAEWMAESMKFAAP